MKLVSNLRRTLLASSVAVAALGLGLGAQAQNRAFSFAYDQPPTTAYGEAAKIFEAKLKEVSGGKFSITIAVQGGPEVPNLGCFLEAIPMERLVWTSMLFPDYRPAVFDDIPITAIVSASQTRCLGASMTRSIAKSSFGSSLKGLLMIVIPSP